MSPTCVGFVSTAVLDRSVVPEILTAVNVESGTAFDTGPKTESADKTFTNHHRNTKFAKVFSRERNPLYDSPMDCV